MNSGGIWRASAGGWKDSWFGILAGKVACGRAHEITGFEGSTSEHEQLIAKPFLPQELAALIAGIL